MTDSPVDGRAASTPRARSRLASGCGIVLFLLVLLAAVAGVGGCYIISQVNRYTSTAPVPIPRYELKPGERDALARRIEEFEAAAAPARLELTAGDLNALLAGAAGGNARPQVRARIDEGGLFLDASIGLGRDRLLARFFEGRFLNASIGLELRIEEGRLRGRVTSAVTAGGERIRDEFLPFLSYEDLLGAFLEEGNLLPSAGTAGKVTVTPRAVVLEK